MCSGGRLAYLEQISLHHFLTTELGLALLGNDNLSVFPVLRVYMHTVLFERNMSSPTVLQRLVSVEGKVHKSQQYFICYRTVERSCTEFGS
jgi:hypothetical protein